MPKIKDVEARHQTQHKLEVMERYWGAWCTILARSRRFSFCPSRLWLVDTHAGVGRHVSEADPDGEVPGSPLLAVLAARNVQRAFPDVIVKVRATDKRVKVAQHLEALVAPFRGTPPNGVDVTVRAQDWVGAVSPVLDEMATDDHPHGGRAAGRAIHAHRSLWFIDPYGLEGLEHMAIERLPVGSEVIINLDLMGAMRHVAKANGGDPYSTRILDSAFGGDRWRAAGDDVGAIAGEALSRSFAESFSNSWKMARTHLLRPSGSQNRALIHLTNTQTAVDAFQRAVRTSLSAGTVIGRGGLTIIQKDNAAKRLSGLFAGLTVHIDDLHAAVGAYDRGQLRAICRRADQNGYGTWREEIGVMAWLLARRTGRTVRSEPTLWDLPDAGEDLG